MNRFVVFYLPALFCILFAPAQANVTRKDYCEIEEATLDPGSHGPAKTFKEGPVILIQIHQRRPINMIYYKVKDKSGECDITFPIDEDNTLVTRDDRIIVTYFNWTVTLILKKNAFAFYKEMYPLANFDHDFPTKGIYRGGKRLGGVTAMKVKKLVADQFVFIALDGDTCTARLIFPHKRVDVKSLKRSVKDVIFNLQTEEKLPSPVTIEFDNVMTATRFIDFARSPTGALPKGWFDK